MVENMKINFMKMAGGMLAPADDHESERMKKFKNNQMYEVEIKLSRNPAFHGKMFAFFGFCFDHWASDKEFMDEREQREEFRKDLTILAGFKKEKYKTHIDGTVEVKVTAESLSYASMDQERFEKCYKAITQAAMTHIFKDCSQQMENRLLSFF